MNMQFKLDRIERWPAALLFFVIFTFALQAQESRPGSRPMKTDSAPSSKPADAEKKNEETFLAITNADVETVTMGRLRGATILAKGTKIWKIGRNIEIPENATRIDASGMKVYPGLVSPRGQGIGVSQFGGGGGRVTDRFDPFAVEVAGALAGGITTIYQNETVMKLQTNSVDNLLVREGGTVRIQIGSGTQRYDTIERFERARNYLLEYREFEARKAAGDKEAKEPSRGGVDEMIIKLLKREVTARFEFDRADEMLSILQFLDDFRFDCVFSGALEAWTIPSELARRGAKVILAPRRREPQDPRRQAQTGSSAAASEILARAGVEFSFYPPPGFDGGEIVTWDGIGGRDLQTLAMEGAWAIRGGLDEQRALEAITISAARILGVDQRVGSLEPGKDADIIITDGPLFDFRSFVQIAIVNGTVQYEKSKSPLFAHVRPRTVPVTEVPAYPEKAKASGDSAAADAPKK